MDPKKPVGREKHVTGGSSSVNKRGDGLGTGPVGNGKRPSGGRGSGSGNRAGGGSSSPIALIIGLIVLLLGGGGGAASLLGGGSTDNTSSQQTQQTTYNYNYSNSGYYAINDSSSSDSYDSDTSLDTNVDSTARAKYTTIKGNKKDQVTIMVYMCGTDLESRSGMATNDLTEMAKATYGSEVNIIVYTGGCSRWKTSGISSSVNQIYQVKNGKLYCLEKDMGNKVMTDPATLTEFIKYCAKNYPANRQDLILWDHGGGSVSGYGYDEKNSRSGSMSLSGISKALKNAGQKFDFIGFDACLMATLENALMLNDYADYLIASEETEPGIGWYYTDWLTALGKNPSMPTTELGKNIIDSFISACNTSARGQKTTLSIIDLAELSATVPEKLQNWSASISSLIAAKEYNTVATARAGSREFAQSTQIDQVDLIDLAYNIGNKEGKELIAVLDSAIKYNKTSTSISHAYGVSIYFPYRKTSKVSTAVSEYSSIGMDDAYMKAIQDYASVQASGQAVSGGTTTSNPLEVLLGSGYSQGSTGSTGSGSSSSGSYSGGTPMDVEQLTEMLSALMGGSGSSSSGSSSSYGSMLGSLLGMDSSSLGFLTGGRALSAEDTAIYVSENQLDLSNLEWKTNADGKAALPMSDKNWALLTDFQLNVFVDDGEGYIDLGLDNVYDVDDAGNLVSAHDGTWLAINGQAVAYYYMSSEQDGDNYTITGYVPAMLNDVRVKLILVFDQDNPYGYIAGASTDYVGQNVDVEAKNLLQLQKGDKLDFLCDYYDYDGNYSDSYYLGESMTVNGTPEISNVTLRAENMKATYVLTDIYQQDHWIDCQ